MLIDILVIIFKIQILTRSNYNLDRALIYQSGSLVCQLVSVLVSQLLRSSVNPT